VELEIHPPVYGCMAFYMGMKAAAKKAFGSDDLSGKKIVFTQKGGGL